MKCQISENLPVFPPGLPAGLQHIPPDHIANAAEDDQHTGCKIDHRVDSIITQLDRLSGWGISIDLGGFGTISFTGNSGQETEASNLMGLDYVPLDGYLTRLHEGEAVLTAEENRIWQGLNNGALANVDLDSLGGVISENTNTGGNVYLDGKVVGAVVSERQGKSYKSLQRSGWQA